MVRSVQVVMPGWCCLSALNLWFWSSL